MTWLIILIAGYALVVALFWALQDRMIFVGADWGRGQPVPNVPGVRVERLELPEGGTFRVAIAVPRGAVKGTMVYFVGNGEDLRSGVHWAALWSDFEQAVVAVEYPGYGESDGVPSKAMFFSAADVAARRARSLAPDVPLTAGGSSIGSFSAVHVAAAGLADRVLLRAPPASIERAGKERFPWLPVSWFLRHDFDNEALAPRVRCPVLIIHGDRDRIVPLSHGKRLRDAFAGTTELVIAEGHGHNDLPMDRHGPVGAVVAKFLGIDD